ncbi:reverse transcriptase domain-containing protein [Tanacetum coccineum]|uniref:Reverse transcriptase domain-containing protein n=1 Tax=Tanacetum coccineum TaxID=301880 RepID=A0ABQ5CRV9_9ASTR
MPINPAAQQVHNQEDSSSTSSIDIEAHEAPPIITTSKEQTSPISLIVADEFCQEDSAYLMAILERPEEDDPGTAMDVEEELLEPWTLFTDGSSCANGFGAGLILTNVEGAEFTYTLRFRFEVTNNEAEYEASIAGLRIAK